MRCTCGHFTQFLGTQLSPPTASISTNQLQQNNAGNTSLRQLDDLLVSKFLQTSQLTKLQCQLAGCDQTSSFGRVQICVQCQFVACAKKRHIFTHLATHKTTNPSIGAFSFDLRLKEFFCYDCNDYVVFLDETYKIKLLPQFFSSNPRKRSTEEMMNGHHHFSISDLASSPRASSSPEEGERQKQQQQVEGQEPQTNGTHSPSKKLKLAETNSNGGIKEEKPMLNGKHLVTTPDTSKYKEAVEVEVHTGLRGLNNLGNTCFMNCILQSLCHNPLLRNYYMGVAKPILNASEAEEKPTGVPKVYEELQKLMYQFHNGTADPLSPHCFLYAMWNAAGHLAGYNQQDAHEFLMATLDAISNSNKIFPTSCKKPAASSSSNGGNNLVNIADLTFRGELQSDVVCTNCGSKSTTVDPFLDVSLHLVTTETVVPNANGKAASEDEERGSDEDEEERRPKRNTRRQAAKAETSKQKHVIHKSIYECLDKYTGTERLGTDVYTCQSCKSKSAVSTKQLSFKKLPIVLCFHFKRFEHGLTGRKKSSNKIDNFVEFPVELDMHPYTSHAVHKKSKVEEHSPTTYQLFAVVQHIGTMETGHYTCYIKHKNNWYLCDDSLIYSATETDVKKCKGYLLFYIKKELAYSLE